MPSSQTLTARWLFPVASPPLFGGTITISGERIVSIEPHGTRSADLDLGDCAILPGLVNAHTHLDLTGMRGLAPPTSDFTSWLRQVIHHRRQRMPSQLQEDVQAGLAECIRTGTTLIGDVSGGSSSWETLAAAPIRSVVYRELLGLPPERAAAAWDAFCQWRQALPTVPHCRPGVSPHAPYSVHVSLYRAAAAAGIPVATHLAETQAELQLLHDHSGPFVDFLQGVGVWAPDGLVHGTQHVLELLKGLAPVAIAHGNYLLLPPNPSPQPPPLVGAASRAALPAPLGSRGLQEVGAASRAALPAPLGSRGLPGDRIWGGEGPHVFPANATVVYCPRTHAAFGHPPHPFREFLQHGLRVALGTDGLASNPDLDLLAEARFLLKKHPDVQPETVLRMATLAGAEALGWADETGSLEPGKSADLIVLPLEAAAPQDPYRLIFGSAAAVSGVMCRGRWLLGPHS